jgi:hypothetical protein
MSWSDVNRAYECQANCYISKPGDLDVLFDIVQAVEVFWFQTATLPRPLRENTLTDGGPEGAD